MLPISYYLPQKIVSNIDLQNEFVGWNAEKISKKIGISSRHIAAENETALDMAEKAANKLFDEYQIQKDEIDFVLLCTQSPDYFLPTSACILQNRRVPALSTVWQLQRDCLLRESHPMSFW